MYMYMYLYTAVSSKMNTMLQILFFTVYITIRLTLCESWICLQKYLSHKIMLGGTWVLACREEHDVKHEGVDNFLGFTLLNSINFTIYLPWLGRASLEFK